MDTLGSATTSLFHKGPEAHKLHHSFEVGDRRATIIFSGDFVASNVINVTVNGQAIAAQTYATSHAATFAALVSAIDGLSGCTATGNSTTRTIVIIPTDQTEDPEVTAAVTLGASQATATIYEENDLYPGCPVELASDGTVIRMQPPFATADLNMIGHALREASAGEIATIIMRGAAIMNALSADSIVPGPVAYSSYDATSGKMKVTDGSVTTANMIGWAIDTADSADDEIQVVLKF